MKNPVDKRWVGINWGRRKIVESFCRKMSVLGFKLSIHVYLVLKRYKKLEIIRKQ